MWKSLGYMDEQATPVFFSEIFYFDMDFIDHIRRDIVDNVIVVVIEIPPHDASVYKDIHVTDRSGGPGVVDADNQADIAPVRAERVTIRV